jgi:DNA transposition AAA+ family ATPase
MNSARADFVVTTEHRRFAEFCDACRRYGYIGLCYGSPGVGKTLSARSYANWDKVHAYLSHPQASEMALAQVTGSQTVFYTPEVVNSPRRIEEDIWRFGKVSTPF